jgi:hypothetical protein
MPDVVTRRPRSARFCHLCGRELSGTYYTYTPGLVVCASCHTSRPRCAACNLPLDDVALARAAGAPAGSPALCAGCERTLPRCNACEQPIIGTFYQFEELLPAAAVRRFCTRCVHHRPHCDLCHAPVAAGAVPLDDGQYRCALCASDMVLDEAAVRAVYQQALAALTGVLGQPLASVPPLEVVGRRQMGQVRRRYERLEVPVSPQPERNAAGHHVLGFCAHEGGRSTIYIERGLPRGLLLGTLAHELGHAWQYGYAPGLRDPLRCEGFAEWVAHRVLVASGLRSLAARATRRDDLYGRGLRHLLALERSGGRAAVLAAMR